MIPCLLSLVWVAKAGGDRYDVGMSNKEKKGFDSPAAFNKKAYRDFELVEKFEAGLQLRGSEVKSLREGRVNLAAWEEAVQSLLLLLAPISPHITEELWARRGRPYSIHQQAWPAFDETIAREEVIELVIQLNGKTRDRIEVPAGLGEDELRRLALESEKVQRMLDGIRCTFFVIEAPSYRGKSTRGRRTSARRG